MSSNSRGLVILNTITLAAMLIANYIAGAGVFSPVTVADISHKYDTLFAPAGYAFIIWSLLFAMGIAFVIYQWKLLKNNDPHGYISRTGIWFSVSNLANTIWLYCWVNELIGWSVIFILLLLVCLCILTIRLRLELDDEPVRTIFFVWWPIVYYLGWIMVATIACIASWLVYSGWYGGALGEVGWTIIMISVASLLYLILLQKRNFREAAGIGIWTFIAIAVRQWHPHNIISIVAIIACVVLAVASGIHGKKHSYYSPAAKIKRGEWK